MFVHEEECKREILDNGVERIIKGYVDELMVVHLKWKKGMEGAVHTHPHTQCVYVLSGSFEASIEDQQTILKAGDCTYITGGKPHGLLALEDGEILDIFTPYREDFVN